MRYGLARMVLLIGLLFFGVLLLIPLGFMAFVALRGATRSSQTIQLPVSSDNSPDNPLPTWSGRVDFTYTTFQSVSVRGTVRGLRGAPDPAGYHGKFTLPTGAQIHRHGEITLQYGGTWVRVALAGRSFDIHCPAGFAARVELDGNRLLGPNGQSCGSFDAEARYGGAGGSLYRRVALGHRELFLCEDGSTQAHMIVGQVHGMNEWELQTAIGLVMVFRGVLDVGRHAGSML